MYYGEWRGQPVAVKLANVQSSEKAIESVQQVSLDDW